MSKGRNRRDRRKRRGKPRAERWSGELARAVGGGDLTAEQEALIEAVLTCRRSLIRVAALARGFGADRPEYRQPTTLCLLTMARAFRALGLSRDDVRRLHLGRRRRGCADA